MSCLCWATMTTDIRSPGSRFTDRAHRIIPGGAHTYSKGDDQFPRNAPRGFVRGKGARVWDVEGREFVDWGMGIQNVLVGHAEDVIDDAACAALRQGQNFSRPTDLEIEAAESVAALFDGLDMVKFAKNGSDVNTAALRLARAVTGRKLIAYDGSAPFLSVHDWFIGNTAMNAGVPDEVSRLAVPFRYNDASSVEAVFERHSHQLAAVILEPCRDVMPRPEFLQRLRALCDAHGTLLIFDEIVTAFRYSLRGAYSLFGVQPDLMSIGKAMANGYALSALVGRREFMERAAFGQPGPRCFFLSTTNGAERSALGAGLATIRFYREYDVIGRLHDVGRRAIEGINQIAESHGVRSHLRATGDFACRPVIDTLDHDGHPSMAYRTLLLQELMSGGVFLNWMCPSFRHGELELAQTLEAFDRACVVYARALEEKSVARYLVGPVIRPVFRTYNECLQTRCGRLYPDAAKLDCCS
jgi:glutamate-1-semialdehyde 2,1-aminomutase